MSRLLERMSREGGKVLRGSQKQGGNDGEGQPPWVQGHSSHAH
jgi:hypothetical protein